jgi:hypothetical protein
VQSRGLSWREVMRKKAASVCICKISEGTAMKLSHSYKLHLNVAPTTMSGSWGIEIIVMRPNRPLQQTKPRRILSAFNHRVRGFAAERQGR